MDGLVKGDGVIKWLIAAPIIGGAAGYILARIQGYMDATP